MIQYDVVAGLAGTVFERLRPQRGQTEFSMEISGAAASGESKEVALMDVVGLLIQLGSGAIGGNAAGAFMKKFSLGTLGNSIVGILGGGIGGQLLGLLGVGGGGGASGAMDLTSILTSVAGGGVGGGVLMAIIGAVRGAMNKSS